jgi:hypothetical protein
MRYCHDALEGLQNVRGYLGSKYQDSEVEIATRDLFNTKQEFHPPKCHHMFS